MTGFIDRIRRFILGSSADPKHSWDQDQDPFIQRMQDETKESKKKTRQSKDWLSIPLSDRFVGYKLHPREEREADEL